LKLEWTFKTHLTLDGWSLGEDETEADALPLLHVSSLRILDHNKWPLYDVMQDMSAEQWHLIYFAGILLIICLCILVRAFRAEDENGVLVCCESIRIDKSWVNRLAELYVVIVNCAGAILGMVLMTGTLVFIAQQGFTFSEVVVERTAWESETRFLFWPCLLGFSWMLFGLVGIRTAMTRKGFYLFIYIIGLALSLNGLALLSMQIGTIDPRMDFGKNISLHRDGDVRDELSSSTLAVDPLGRIGKTLSTMAYKEGMHQLVGKSHQTFRELVSSSHYQCDVTAPGQGQCAAELHGARMMKCKRADPVARGFEHAVNTHCTKDVDLSKCGDCLQKLGDLVDDPGSFDETDSHNMIFCKCISNMLQKYVNWVNTADWILNLAIGSIILLVFCEVYLMCCVPDNQELFADQLRRMKNRVSGRKTVNQPKLKHNHHRGDRRHEQEMASLRSPRTRSPRTRSPRMRSPRISGD